MPPAHAYLPLVAAALGGALATFVVAHLVGCPIADAKKAALPKSVLSKGAYVLAVKLKIKPGTLELLKTMWAPLASHCRSPAEPGCLSYELVVQEDVPAGADGIEVLIYERYAAKADLTGPHWGSDAFKAFGKALAESGILLSKERWTGYETNVGHMVRTA